MQRSTPSGDKQNTDSQAYDFSTELSTAVYTTFMDVVQGDLLGFTVLSTVSTVVKNVVKEIKEFELTHNTWGRITRNL